MNNKPKKDHTLRNICIIIILFVFTIFSDDSSNKNQNKKVTYPKNYQQQTVNKPSSSQNMTEKDVKNDDKQTTEQPSTTYDSNDPLHLSFTDSEYLIDSKLRYRLKDSELEYCSHIVEDDPKNLTLTWNLKSNDKEVYACVYNYDRNRSYKKASMVTCSASEGYEDYKNGDTALIRDYVMPDGYYNNQMWVHPKSAWYNEYYQREFILGKYSDMYCFVDGEDIHCEFYWYQNTDEGPALVYKSVATNHLTDSGQRYRDDLWELFEQSYKNIDIIPYEEYPRDKDYYEVFEVWEHGYYERLIEEREREQAEIYCICHNSDDLYDAYTEEFDSWEEADDYYQQHCE